MYSRRSSESLTSAEQRETISADVNSTLFLLFLAGIYIGVYAGTLHMYLKGHTAGTVQRHIVAWTLTVIFLAFCASATGELYYTNITYSIHSASRLEMFISDINMPFSLSITTNTLDNIGLLLANALMVWRCFHVCGRSILGFYLPVILLFCESALAMASVIFRICIGSNPDNVNPKKLFQEDYLSAGFLASVAATSLLVTFSICHRIYSSTALVRSSRRRYIHIVDIIVQSCVVYTTFVISLTVLGFLTPKRLESTIRIVALEKYLGVLVNVASGLIPTLMVARLSILAASKDTGTNVTSEHIRSTFPARTQALEGGCFVGEDDGSYENFYVDEQPDIHINQNSLNQYINK